MKKLLILALMTGLAATANAALVLSFNDDTNITATSVNVGDTYMIGVYSPSGTLPDEFWVNFTGGFSYSGYGTVYAPPAPDHLIADDGGYGYPWIHAYMSQPDALSAPGKWWDLEVHCESEGDVVIELYDTSGYVVIDTMTISQVPEPLTVSLLGLGGLLLRRRKK